VPELRLAGCRSRPLLGYLKALGLLRILAREADPNARARWQRGTFELRSNVHADGLATLLLDDYAPAPVVSPWNGGSGFHPKDRKDAILALERSTEPRFAPYRAAIAGARDAASPPLARPHKSPANKPAILRAVTEGAVPRLR